MARNDGLADEDIQEWICSLRSIIRNLEQLARAGSRGLTGSVPLDSPIRYGRVKERSDGHWTVSLSGRSFTLPPLLGLLFALLAADPEGTDATVARPKTQHALRAQVEQHRGAPITSGALAQALTRLRDRLELHELGLLLEYCVAVKGYRVAVSGSLGRTVADQLAQRLQERAGATARGVIRPGGEEA